MAVAAGSSDVTSAMQKDVKTVARTIRFGTIGTNFIVDKFLDAGSCASNFACTYTSVAANNIVKY